MLVSIPEVDRLLAAPGVVASGMVPLCFSALAVATSRNALSRSAPSTSVSAVLILASVLVQE